jgi:hypothetical protein
MGDARLNLARSNDPQFDILVVDAFSSDAIPVHLLNLEAVQLYLDRTGPAGIVAIHISNKYLDLLPVIARIASELKLSIRVKDDVPVTKWEGERMKYASRWVVLARTPAAIDRFANISGWVVPETSADFPLWTDNYSNLFSLLL